MATKFHIDKSTTWWVTTPAQRKKSLTPTFSQNFIDFVGHISLPCYSKIVDPCYGFWEKAIWFCVHTCAGCLLIVFLSHAWLEFVHQYFATTLYDPLYPVEKVPFPAVSICSNNRISRQAALKYADELSKVDPARRNSTFFMKRILWLGLLYNTDYAVGSPDVNQFQKFLDIYGTAENESYYNTLKKMAMLTPPCADLFLKCTLAGENIDCLSNKAFKPFLTSYGHCCTFNSNNIYTNRYQKQRFSNFNLGLTVILNTSSNDIHFPLLRMDGTAVIIHSPYKFPDISSGGASEIFITNGEDNFLSIKPYVVDSVQSMRQFGPKTRNCYFEDENPYSFYKLKEILYSFNNCITRCRIQSITVLCKCLPFNMPYDLTPNGTKTVFCTLQHLDCLQRYRFKWKSVLSSRVVIPGLERETEDALYCPQCLPACSDIMYKAYLQTLPLDQSTINNFPPHDQNDITVLRVYFSEPYIMYYRQIVRNSWFEAFSTIGNYCGIIIGFSLTVICEVVYFIGRQITLTLKQGLQNEHQTLTIYP